MDFQPSSPVDAATGVHPPSTLSKNQQKKLKRDQEWEANRAARKAKRKEKIQEKKQNKRAAREQLPPTASVDPKPFQETTPANDIPDGKKESRPQHVQLPITLLLDCGFDELMMDKENKSLASQITRCYSDTHKAPFQAHLAISSFGGRLKERFDGLLAGNYRSWRNVRFLEEDFVKGTEHATGWMTGPEGGKLAAVFARHEDNQKKPEERSQSGEIVYLTSDSPDTLTELRPYSTYIIGGLVDRNRHKGICYKTAMNRGIKTAKLPIGDYMKMNSRFVLATNHVVEIMLRWLELGDWGKAFDMVIPKRKGGVLKEKIGVSKEEADVDTAVDYNDVVENGDDESQTMVPSTKAACAGSNAGAGNDDGYKEGDAAADDRNDAVDDANEDLHTVLSNTKAEYEDSDAAGSYVDAGTGGGSKPTTGRGRKGKKRAAEVMEDGEAAGESKRAKANELD